MTARRKPRSYRGTLKSDPELPLDDPEPCLIDEEADDPDSGPKEPSGHWLNTFIAVLLLPIAGIWTQTFFTIFSRETLHHGFWRTVEFFHFFLGADIAVLAFFGLRHSIDYTFLWRCLVVLGRGFLGIAYLFGLRGFFLGVAERSGLTDDVAGRKRRPFLVLIYVFGHELTHAIWVWLMGGRVGKFRVGSRGGYITTDKQNFLISLAPYFYPIYSVAVVICFAIASLFCNVAPHIRWLFFALGLTWAFHISFTIWMIPKGQSDLENHGNFFSWVIIYVMNLGVITGFMLITAPGVTFRGFARQFAHNTVALVHGTVFAWDWLLKTLGSLLGPPV